MQEGTAAVPQREPPSPPRQARSHRDPASRRPLETAALTPRLLPAAIYRASPGRPPLAGRAPAAPPAASRCPPLASEMLPSPCLLTAAGTPAHRSPGAAAALGSTAQNGGRARERGSAPPPPPTGARRARPGASRAPSPEPPPSAPSARRAPPGGPRRRSPGPLPLSAHREPLVHPWPCPGSRSRRARRASSLTAEPSGGPTPAQRPRAAERPGRATIAIPVPRAASHPPGQLPRTRHSRRESEGGGGGGGREPPRMRGRGGGVPLRLSPPPPLRGRPGACALHPQSRGGRRSFWRQAGARAARSGGGARACPGMASRRRHRLAPALMAAAAAGRALELVSGSARPSPSAQLWEGVSMRKVARCGRTPWLLLTSPPQSCRAGQDPASLSAGRAGPGAVGTGRAEALRGWWRGRLKCVFECNK